MAEGAVALAALGIGAALIKLLDYLLKRSDKTIEKNTEAAQAQAVATSKLAGAVTELNKSTKEQEKRDQAFQKLMASELREIKITAGIINDKADRNYEAVIKNQTVKSQIVEHQIVAKEGV